MSDLDVIIVGGGVAGLSCATELIRHGVHRIHILERETHAGGIPRHCGHWGFGLREFGTLLRGPEYSRHLVGLAPASELLVNTTALSIDGDRGITIAGAKGVQSMRAKAIVLAMGARETPRSGRLISGSRPHGIMNTGTLQQSVYLFGALPFRKPVIVGSELVSFSAILTLRHAGARPIAMIEENERMTARRPGDWIARHVFGIPVMLGTKLVRILGDRQVEAIEIDNGRGLRRLECDGVVLTGRFRPENALIANSHLVMDDRTLGPAIDSLYRCSDPAYFAAGNVLRGIETAGQCWREGRAVARSVVKHLDGKLPAPNRVAVTCGGAIAYAYPQFLDRKIESSDPLLFKARVKHAVKGRLRVLADGREMWSRDISALPERRIAWQVSHEVVRTAGAIEVRLDTR